MQLRYLQTLRDIGNNPFSTIVFPMPLDLLKPLLQATSDTTQRGHRTCTTPGHRARRSDLPRGPPGLSARIGA